MHAYTNHGPRAANAQQTPQTQPIPGSNQVLNNAGGYSWTVDDTTRLHRFLILGSSGGTFYVGEHELTKQNLDVVYRLIKADQGKAVVNAILEISRDGRAASNDPALFALARCIAPDVPLGVRQRAFEILPQVARTGTHLLHFVHFARQFRGWGRAYRRAVAAWFNDRKEQSLAYQRLKYQSRDGCSQRDLLRLAHPKAETATYNTIYHWVTKGWESVGDEPHPDEALQIIWAYERAKRATDEKEVARLISTYRLPREAVPTQWLHSIAVWEALLEEMPMEAMLRNLATMTREGVITPFGKATRSIYARLHDKEAIRKARLHPIKILAALKTYESGKSVRGSAIWTPVQEIVDALNDAFYLSFGAIPPNDKRLLIAIDVSGSMSYGRIGSIPNLPVHEAAAAMAMVSARNSYTEMPNGLHVPTHHIVGVDTRLYALSISPEKRLDDVARILGQFRGGGTDLALPMLYALKEKLVVDAFIMYSDSETWAGRPHLAQALAMYRAAMNPQARLINVQMTATSVTNNDPNDPLALEVVGFDTATPQIITSFAAGEF